MGCCESREKTPQKPENSQDKNQTFREGLKNLESVNNETLQDKLRHIEELETSSMWKLMFKQKNIEVCQIPSSKYSSEFPVARTQVVFEGIIPVKKLVEKINNPQKRLKWDKMFSQIEVLEGNPMQESILRSVVNSLGYKGEYLTKKNIGYYKDSVTIVEYSIEDPRFPLNKNCTRGNIHFAVTKVYCTEQKTYLVFYNQVDPNTKLVKVYPNFISRSLKNWSINLSDSVNKDIKL